MLFLCDDLAMMYTYGHQPTSLVSVLKDLIPSTLLRWSSAVSRIRWVAPYALDRRTGMR